MLEEPSFLLSPFTAFGQTNMKKIIVANWKMNPPTSAEAKRLFRSIKGRIKNIKNVEVVVCPPFVYLPILGASTFAKGYAGLAFGSQDSFWEDPPAGGGAFTGEISPKMLKDLGIKYVIIGHSERRQYLKETDEMINKKLKVALAAKLKPIFCIGETQKEKNRGQGVRVLNSQISRGLKGIKEREAKNIILAYEPVWAIGTGKPCDTKAVLMTKLLIRGVLKKRYSPTISQKIQILYGGSVTAKTASNYVKEAKMEGLLVGGASLDPKEFTKIVKVISET